jgi:hypothetical protein
MTIDTLVEAYCYDLRPASEFRKELTGKSIPVEKGLWSLYN